MNWKGYGRKRSRSTRHLPEATDEGHQISQDGGFSSRDSNLWSMKMAEHVTRLDISTQWKQRPCMGDGQTSLIVAFPLTLQADYETPALRLLYGPRLFVVLLSLAHKVQRDDKATLGPVRPCLHGANARSFQTILFCNMEPRERHDLLMAVSPMARHSYRPWRKSVDRCT
jgi:hypothetical protein